MPGCHHCFGNQLVGPTYEPKYAARHSPVAYELNLTSCAAQSLLQDSWQLNNFISVREQEYNASNNLAWTPSDSRAPMCVISG